MKNHSILRMLVALVIGLLPAWALAAGTYQIVTKLTKESGPPPTSGGALSIDATWGAGAAVTKNGCLLVWGSNSYITDSAPTGCGFKKVVLQWNQGYALKTDGTLIGWGNDPDYGYPLLATAENPLTGVMDVSKGAARVFVQLENGPYQKSQITGYVKMLDTPRIMGLRPDGSLDVYRKYGSDIRKTYANVRMMGYQYISSYGYIGYLFFNDGSMLQISVGSYDHIFEYPLDDFPCADAVKFFGGSDHYFCLKPNGRIVFHKTSHAAIPYDPSAVPTDGGFVDMAVVNYNGSWGMAIKADGTVTAWGNVPPGTPDRIE